MMRRGAPVVTSLLQACTDLLRHEANPLRNTYTCRTLAACYEIPQRVLKHYPKQSFDVAVERRGKVVRLLDERVVASLPFADLVGFGVDNADKKPKVLIAAALSGHHATLLRDTVKGFARDFDPYITDWKDARHVPIEEGDFGLDEFIDYLMTFMAELGPGTHMVATCQAAPAALTAAALLAERNPELVPASLTLMAGPMDTRVNKNLLGHVADRVPLDLLQTLNIATVPPGLPGSGRRVYPGVYQLSGFILLSLVPHLKRYGGFLNDLVHGDEEAADTFREFYDEYFAVLDMTESFYVDSLKRIFFEHHLPRGLMTFRGEPVDFGAIKDMPLLTIEGAKDNMCSLGQTQAAHDICPNIPEEKRAHYVQEGVGHYGIFSGSRFQKEIYPVARDFIKAAA